MIVFGHNSFLLHAAKPSQLGLPSELDEQFIIERRQRYFHLFWIPTFGIGKIWTLRKMSDNQLYEPNGQLASLLNSLPLQEKTPWYTYSLLVIAFTAGLLWSVYQKVDRYQSSKRAEANRQEEYSRERETLAKLTPHHYLKLHGGGESLSMKVVSVGKDSIKFQYTFAEGGYDDHALLKLFSDDSEGVKALAIARADLLKTIWNPDPRASDGYPIIPDHADFLLDEIQEYSFPVFENVTAAFEEGHLQATLRNIGAAAEFDSLYAVTSSIDFDGSPFPKQVQTGDYVILDGSYTDIEPSLAGKVRFHNSAGQTADYVLTISGSRTSLRLAQ